jgi:hypothetical protein
VKPFLVFLLLGLLYAQSDLPPDKSRISGVVTNSVTGSGVRYAKVTLTPINRLLARRDSQVSASPVSTKTDSEGRFAFAGVEAGDYRLEAERDGFERMQTPALEILRLTQADEKKGVQVRLAPLAAVSGRVRDKDGFPVRDAQISVLTYQYTTGGRTLVKTASASTNDLGEYRVFDIPHGKYILFASPGKGSAADTAAGEAYRPTYYPGTLDPASAGLIEIQPGTASD